MKHHLILAALLVLSLALTVFADTPAEPWPPALPGAVHGTVTITSPDFLVIPETVKKALAKPGAAPFTMAKTPPTVELAAHGDLPNQALNGTGWSAWGDICVGSDGKVYCGIGDHGDDVGGKAHAYVYCWDPATKILRQIADGNKIAGVKAGDPSFGKVHARILEGADKKIYFTCTLDDGGRAGEVKWTADIPGGLIYQYDPATGKTVVVGHFDGEVTATTLVDPKRNIWYACLEGRPVKPAYAALGAFDLTKKKWIYTSPHDAIYADRNLAMDLDGNVYFNGKEGELWKYDRTAGTIAPTGCIFQKDASDKTPTYASMRSSTPPTKAGDIYGTTMGPGLLFHFQPAKNKLEMLGPDFLEGDYTTVTVLSPDEKYVYYMPGSHGGAKDTGTPVVQYDIATRTRKVLGFLREPIEKTFGVVVAGSYGVKLSADGSTLYVNFNGHARDDIRPAKMNPIGFGLTSFAAIHIPASER